MDENRPAKRDFLVVYDYGMGGLWAVIRARSADEIHARYRELDVLEEWPGWMTQDFYDEVRSTHYIDVDEPTSAWLKMLAMHREAGA